MSSEGRGAAERVAVEGRAVSAAHSGHQDATTDRQMSLEERHLDLEQELADVTAQLRNLRAERA
jgi:hypothetical protein